MIGMTLDRRNGIIIAGLGGLFLALAGLRAVDGDRAQGGRRPGSARRTIAVAGGLEGSASTATRRSNPGIIDHWKGSTARREGRRLRRVPPGRREDADAFEHYGAADRDRRHAARLRALPRPRRREFARSHHAKAGNILASLDNFLAETVEGARDAVQPALADAGQGRRQRSTACASAFSGCQQCHGSQGRRCGRPTAA